MGNTVVSDRGQEQGLSGKMKYILLIFVPLGDVTQNELIG